VARDIRTKIRRKMVEAISDYSMLSDGDQVMLAVSGGKDSTAMAMLFKEIQAKAPFNFDFSAVLLDQKQPGFNPENFQRFMDGIGIPVTILNEDTYSIVKSKVIPGKSFCGLCSRLRRGILYNYAHDQGFNKIALGHHRDDLNETVILNLLYGGRLASMPPKLKSDDGRNTVIRPLSYVPEQWLESLATAENFPIIPCNLCGSQENLRRNKIKKILSKWENDEPGIKNSLLSAQKNIRPSQLLDKEIFDFNFG